MKRLPIAMLALFLLSFASAVQWDYATFGYDHEHSFDAFGNWRLSGAISGAAPDYSTFVDEAFPSRGALPIPSDSEKRVAQVLQLMGDQGWELVDVIRGPKTTTMYFKRPR